MNTRWTVVLSIIALSLLAWFYSLNQDKAQLTDLIKAPDSPEYIGYNMQTTVYSLTGKKQYLANAQKVEYYNSDGRTEFTKPEVYLLDAETEKKNTALNNTKTNLIQQNWQLSADSAQLTKDNILNLQGNVIAQSLSSLSRLQRVETQTAQINLKTQDITSDQMVKINGQNFTSTGLKLVGNLQQQVATLKEQVKTYYEISQQ